MTSTASETITAKEWFHQGRRVIFNPKSKEIINDESATGAPSESSTPSNPAPDDRWVTLLPGFPDGSYGWSKVDANVESKNPRLYVEYVGQGDSDKPSDYHYSTVERAGLVEAQWRAHGIRRTVLATFDYSSIVMLELLQRQKERLRAGRPLETRIEHILSINGGLFADGHSHPWTTTPLLQTWMGRVGCWFAQRSTFVFNTMISPLFSDEYGVTKEELAQIADAITCRNGAAFMSYAAGFVKEHKRLYAERWNLEDVFHDVNKDGVTFQLVGSEKDQFERKQIVLAHERLGKHDGLDIRIIPGGHMATSEQADTLAALVDRLAEK